MIPIIIFADPKHESTNPEASLGRIKAYLFLPFLGLQLLSPPPHRSFQEAHPRFFRPTKPGPRKRTWPGQVKMIWWWWSITSPVVPLVLIHRSHDAAPNPGKAGLSCRGPPEAKVGTLWCCQRKRLSTNNGENEKWGINRHWRSNQFIMEEVTLGLTGVSQLLAQEATTQLRFALWTWGWKLGINHWNISSIQLSICLCPNPLHLPISGAPPGGPAVCRPTRRSWTSRSWDSGPPVALKIPGKTPCLLVENIIMREKQCHSPTRKGNGKHTTYKNLGNGLSLFYPHDISFPLDFPASTCHSEGSPASRPGFCPSSPSSAACSSSKTRWHFTIICGAPDPNLWGV